MDDIHGELRGFKVSVGYLPSLVLAAGVAATNANISWDWDKNWLEEQGKIGTPRLQGKYWLPPFPSQWQQGWSRLLLIYPGTGIRTG